MIDYTFSSGEELLTICREAQIPISEAAVRMELEREEMNSVNKIIDQVQQRL